MQLTHKCEKVERRKKSFIPKAKERNYDGDLKCLPQAEQLFQFCLMDVFMLHSRSHSSFKIECWRKVE